MHRVSRFGSKPHLSERVLDAQVTEPETREEASASSA